MLAKPGGKKLIKSLSMGRGIQPKEKLGNRVRLALRKDGPDRGQVQDKNLKTQVAPIEEKRGYFDGEKKVRFQKRKG